MDEENILLNIEFNSDDIKENVKSIVDGRKAIDSLLEANKKLAEQGQKNSSAYVKNQESIKALNSEIATSSKVIQANTQAVKANEDSIDGLKAANKQLLIERNKISTATEEGKKQIADLNTQYDKNSKIIAENSTQVEKQRFNIGNYASALDKVVPGLGQFASGLDKAADGQKGLTTASKAFIATGIGAVVAAVGLALSALTAYFKGSEEGQDKLNKVTLIAASIWEQFMNLVEGVGEAIVEAIENPQQAIEDFGQLLKDNIINRLEGMAEFIPAIGTAIKELFAGNFAEAGKVAFDAVAKVTTGVEGASDKISAFIDETGRLIDVGIENGKRLADLQSQIDKDERKLVEDRQKSSLEVSKLRSRAIEEEGAVRKKTIKEAIALEEELAARETALAKLGQEQAALKVEANGNDKEALDELAAAKAKVFQAEEAAFANTLRFRKELESLDKEEQKNIEEKKKKLEEIADKEQKAAEELVILKLQAQAAEIEGAQLKADKLIEIEQVKAEQLLANEELTQSERQIIQLESEEQINEILKTSQAEQEKEQTESLARSLEEYKLYIQELINVEKEKLLAGTISQEEYNQEIQDLETAALETQLAIKEQFGEADIALSGRITDAKIAQKEFEAKETERLEKFKVQAVQSTLGQVASLFNKNSIAFKALASAQTLIQTYQSAQAVFTGMTSTIPGPVGIALGIAGAAAAVIGGLANVAKINQTQVPKLEEGGVIEVGGKRHAQGGENVSIGGKVVANVEQGENMVVVKRGSSKLLRHLSSVNEMLGGRDFFNDRSPRYHNQDGGFVARSAGSAVSNFSQLSITEDLKKVKIFTRITDIERVQSQVNTATITSELS